jgi:hypothetical protein
MEMDYRKALPWAAAFKQSGNILVALFKNTENYKKN